MLKYLSSPDNNGFWAVKHPHSIHCHEQILDIFMHKNVNNLYYIDFTLDIGDGMSCIAKFYCYTGDCLDCSNQYNGLHSNGKWLSLLLGNRFFYYEREKFHLGMAKNNDHQIDLKGVFCVSVSDDGNFLGLLRDPDGHSNVCHVFYGSDCKNISYHALPLSTPNGVYNFFAEPERITFCPMKGWRSLRGGGGEFVHQRYGGEKGSPVIYNIKKSHVLTPRVKKWLTDVDVNDYPDVAGSESPDTEQRSFVAGNKRFLAECTPENPSLSSKDNIEGSSWQKCNVAECGIKDQHIVSVVYIPHQKVYLAVGESTISRSSDGITFSNVKFLLSRSKIVSCQFHDGGLHVLLVPKKRGAPLVSFGDD
jgi:hypothetical protein